MNNQSLWSNLICFKIQIKIGLDDTKRYYSYTQVVIFGIGLNGDTFVGWLRNCFVVQLVIVDRLVESIRPLPFDINLSSVETGCVQEARRTWLVDICIGEDRFGGRSFSTVDNSLNPNFVCCVGFWQSKQTGS